MGINQLLPFERNRYYTGKLLTSADFLAEQAYVGNKRQFVNNVMFGAGVVCGLDVYNLDDVTVMVESGVALDSVGREIVLNKSVMLKLSAIEGFDDLSGDSASLMLGYSEEPVHPVYSVAQREVGGDEYEFNRVQEGWRLYLADSAENRALETEFLSVMRLYADDDYEINIAIPACVSCGTGVKLTVIVQKLSASPRSLSLDCTMQTPAFVNANGEYEMTIRLGELLLQQGEIIEREYWLTAQNRPAPESMIVAKSNFVNIIMDGETKHPKENFHMKVAVEDIAEEIIIERALGRVGLEAREMMLSGGDIHLAQITLQRSRNAYIIEKIDCGVKQYIRTMASERLRREYAACFTRKPAVQPAGTGETAEITETGKPAREPLYASGICEIPLEPNARKGSIAYSDEIMHGLGNGNVLVSVGFEYMREDPRDSREERNIIYGNPELFPETKRSGMFSEDEAPVVFAETAVKVLAERGAFIVAARLNKPTSFVAAVMRWVAIRLPAVDDDKLLHKLAGKSISAVTPTVVLGTRETHYFAVHYHNMEPCTLTYELTDKNAGEITAEGIYTAPARDGVYEIRISCADLPLVSTYAYAVVKKKNEMDKQ